MVRRPTFLIVLASCALGVMYATPGAQAPGPTSPGITSISGRVVDGITGTPVSDAVVTIGGSYVQATFDDIVSIDSLDRQLMDMKRRTQVRTDRSGRFAFNGLPAGSYGLSARMDGWTTGAYGAVRPGDAGQRLEVSEGQRATATIPIWKHPWIGGTVVDDNGAPVEGAQIQVLRWQLSAGRRTLKAVTFFATDDRGQYGGDVPPGEYLVRVQSDRTRVEEWTGPDVPISGLSPVFYPSSLSPEGAELISLAPSARLANVSFQLTMRPMRRVAGRLTNPIGAGTLPTSLTLISQDGLDTRRGVSVDPQGRFLIDRLFPGRYLLEAQSLRNLTPGPVPMLWARTLIDVQETDGIVTVPLRRGLIARGRLEFDGPDPPSAHLLREFSVFMRAPPGVIGDVITSDMHVRVQADGTFALELPGGEFLAILESGLNTAFDPAASRPSEAELKTLSGWRPSSVIANGRDIIDAPLVLATDVSDVVITLSRSTASARGRLQVRQNRPQDYRVVLIPADPALWAHPTGRRFAAAPVGNDGGFNVWNVPDGDYLIGAVRGLPSEWRDGDLIAQLAIAMRGIHLAGGDSSVQIDPPAFDMPTGRVRAVLPAAADAGIDLVVPEAVPSLPLPSFAGATITGRVVSAENGQPLSDVRVSPYPAVWGDTFTDAAGRFILQRVSPGSRAFHASKRGWIEATGGRAGMVLTVNGDRVEDVVIRMTQTAEITGAVHDQDGMPVKGLGVRAWKYQPDRDLFERTHRSPDVSTATDEQGHYRLTGLPPGRYLVSTTPHIAREETEIPVTTADDLDRAAGRVIPRGRERGQPPPRGYPAVFSGGAADAASATPIELTRGITRNVDLDVRLVPLSTVVVTLRSPDGVDLSNLSARLEVADRLVRSFSQLWEYPARQQEGTLVFENMLPGRFAFGARTRSQNGAYYSAFADVLIIEGEPQTFTFDLLPGATVSGRVTIDGAPPAAEAGFSIRAFDVSNRMDFAVAEPGASVAEDGTFRIWPLMPGRYRFSLTRQGRTFENLPVSQIVANRETLHAGLELAAGQEVSNVEFAVVTKGAEITGVVRDAAGRPAPASTVVLFPADRASWHPRSPHIVSVRTDRQGSYVLKNIPAGDYRVAAAELPPDVWLDAEILSKLFERSVATRVEPARAMTVELTMP